MATNNAINANDAGLIRYDGTSTFDSVTTTNHNLLIGSTSNGITNVSPSATSGVPVISQGASADPTFGTAVVAGGGTGQTTLTNHGVLIGQGTSAIAATAAGTSGQVLQSGGAGGNPSYSTATYPSTAGTSGNVLTSDGTNWASSAPSGAFVPNSVMYIKDDFTNIPSIVTTPFSSEFAWVMSGVFTNASASQISTNPGLILSPSNPSGQVRGITSGSSGSGITFVLGGGAIAINWVIKLATLSNGTNRYTLYVGLTDWAGTAASAPTNGTYFTYSDNVNSGNWVGNTTSASSTSTANSSVAAINSAFVNLGITINAAGTSVGFFINGTQIANSPLAANIPTAAIAPSVFAIASAGTVPAGALVIDLFYLTQTLTTPR